MFVLSAADLDLPMVTVSLASRSGYFRQTIDSKGRQHEQTDQWNPGEWAKPLEARAAVPIN